MKKFFRYLAFVLMTGLLSIASFAQTTTITGHIKNSINKEAVPAVSIVIKGSPSGTYTDDKGNFKLPTNQKFPLTLVISSVGFESKEVVVNSSSDQLDVDFEPASTLGTEVVVSASRVPERILESPVSIERMSTASIRNAAAPGYYDATANLKGVDLTTSSLTFKTVSTRGFNGSGNLRFNQLVDGIDNQAPGLNFAVGNIVGPTELDVDNIELLPGASSALYGSGGMNGTLLLTSKNPFKYQGLSFQVKQGIMHTDGSQRPISPYYDWALRWGKQVSNKFAFKIGAQFIQAKDWQAGDNKNLLRNNVFSSVKAGDRQSDPNYNGVNVFGDEASASMNYLAQAVRAQVRQLSPTGLAAIDQMISGGLPYNTIVTNVNGSPLAGLSSYLPFLVPSNTSPNNSYKNIFGSQFISRTGYDEKDIVDYNTYNIKLTGGLYYKITDNVEASLLGYWGTGTTVYTGADRYAIKNLKMGQYKAEIKGKNWFLRGYTVQENSGDAYTATTAALFINRVWKSDATWFQTYTATYGTTRMALNFNDVQAHVAGRTNADAGRLLPGTPAFNDAFNNAKNTSINKGGSKFEDKTDLYHLEGQYNLSDKIKVVDVLVGASYQLYRLNSQGTIFADTTGPININEFGTYVQVQKWFLNNVLKLTGSLRYDKSQNFKGRVTPRITGLFKVAENNNIRVSFQTAYRFPATQDQYINLLTGGANRLIGGLPQFNTYFKFDTNPSYTAESIDTYRNSIAAGARNPTLLQKAQFQKIRPETMNSFELGYKGLITKSLLIDVYGYYSMYKDFIGRVAVARGKSGDPAQYDTELASPFTTDNYSFVVNTENDVKAIGWGIGLNYQLIKGFELNANISSDQLDNVPSTLFTQFNTPKLRYNIGLGNPDLGKGVGFNLIYRWQDKVYWEGTFATGNIPSFGTFDAQVSYKFPKTKNLLKIGASNLLNKYYQSAFGNPEVGGLYYMSFGFNVF
ncbi:MAG: TonB-dependent receptor [Chitinophagaceae bacterium]